MKFLPWIVTIAAYINFFLPCFASSPINTNLLEEGLDTRIQQAYDSFENRYYQLVENGHFPLSYNNNLIINASLFPDVQKEGSIIIKLIEWLEQQDDADSIYLLRRLNKFYFLKFHQFICSMNLKKEYVAKILEHCQTFYSLKAINKSIVLKPFQSALSKLFIMIYMINESFLSYEQKRETLAHSIDKIKREMLSINKQFGPVIDEKKITSFIMLLETYGAKEPLVQSSKLKKVVIISVIIFAISIIVYKYVLPNWGGIKKWFSNAWTAIVEPLGESAGRGAVNAFINGLDDPANREKLKSVVQHITPELLNEILADQDRFNKFVSSLRDNLPPGILNMPTQDQLNSLTEGALRAAVNGMANTAGNDPGNQQPNPDLKAIGRQVGQGVAEGIGAQTGILGRLVLRRPAPPPAAQNAH